MSREHYAFVWVDYAHAELLAKPESLFVSFTHPNTKGGLIGWNPDVEYVYLAPKTPKESLLSLEIRDILRIALENAVREAEYIRHPYLQMRWSVRSVIEAHRLSEMLERKDPMVSLKANVRLKTLDLYLSRRLTDLQRVYGGASDGLICW